MDRSAVCWLTDMARISRARPMALSRPEIWPVVGTGRSSPAAGGGDVSGSREPMLARRRVANSSWVMRL